MELLLDSMNIFSYISEGIGTLIQNKMRSFLSLLGVVIGITSVVVLTAIGDGMKDKIIKEMVSTQNIIKIARGEVSSGAGWFAPPTEMPSEANKETHIGEEIASEQIFTHKTLKLLQNLFADRVIAIVPVIPFQTSGQNFVEGNGEPQYFGAKVVENTYFLARNIKAQRGTLFTQTQAENAEAVAIIGNRLVSSLFQEQDPIGKKIFMNNTAFTVVGILEYKQDYEVDSTVFIPHTTAKERFWIQKIDSIEVYAKDIQKMHDLQKDLGFFLMKYTGSDDPSRIQFHLETNERLLKEINESINQMAIFISSIAAISLFVGGIGIMNIMLVSVTERTREIGIRKAIGARRKDIILQFLTESSILSFVGGITAVGLSYVICFIIQSLFPSVSTLISVNTILIATSFSIFMGIVFGLLPAWKAAKMDAIEALRFE